MINNHLKLIKKGVFVGSQIVPGIVTSNGPLNRVQLRNELSSNSSNSKISRSYPLKKYHLYCEIILYINDKIIEFSLLVRFTQVCTKVSVTLIWCSLYVSMTTL